MANVPIGPKVTVGRINTLEDATREIEQLARELAKLKAPEGSTDGGGGSGTGPAGPPGPAGPAGPPGATGPAGPTGALDTLSDVSTGSAVDGQVLTRVGGIWVGADSSGMPALGTFPAISGLVCRLSAELSTMTQQTDNRISSITDLGGSGFVFTASGSARPRLNPRGYNHLRPALIFDGSTTKITSTTSFGLTAGTAFSVVFVLENWGRTGAANLNLFRDAGFAAVVFMNTGTNQWSMFAGGTSITSSAFFSQNQEARDVANEGAPAIMQAIFDGASSVFSNNGIEITGNPGNTQGITGALTIGGDASTSFARMNLYEALFFNKALSPTERGQLNTYYADACQIKL